MVRVHKSWVLELASGLLDPLANKTDVTLCVFGRQLGRLEKDVHASQDIKPSRNYLPQQAFPGIRYYRVSFSQRRFERTNLCPM